MDTVERVYTVIAEKMIAAVNTEKWQKLILYSAIRTKMVSSEFVIFLEHGTDETKYVKSISDACFFLRDNLLSTTGKRIWGLTFTLYPNSKFNIEYDYNKPVGYEESDDVITAKEINQSLNNISK